MPPFGPLVTPAWLSTHLDEPDLRIVHVSPTRRGWVRGRIPGAVFGDLHRQLALRGRSAETGDVEREWLLPSRDDVASALEAWGVSEGDRIVFYDDYGLNRQAIRGYWLLRLYRYPAARLAVLDGGLTAWRRAGGALTGEDVPPPARRGEPPSLGPLDPSLVATTAEVRGWSAEASRTGGPTRVLDVRTGDEYLGDDLRAARGGHVPGARHRLFSDFLRADGTLRSPDEAIRLLRAGGVEPGELRVTYCQGGVRATLPWFILHELGGLPEVRSYAGSWEEWGNRSDTPIER